MLAVETTGCIPFILRSNLHFICNPLVCTRQHTRTRRVDLRNVHPNAILGELEGVVNSFFVVVPRFADGATGRTTAPAAMA